MSTEYVCWGSTAAASGTGARSLSVSMLIAELLPVLPAHLLAALRTAPKIAAATNSRIPMMASQSSQIGRAHV